MTGIEGMKSVTTATTGPTASPHTATAARTTTTTGLRAVAGAEFRMLGRNRLVAGCAILLPLAFGVVFYLTRDTRQPGGSVAGVQTIFMIAMGTYVTATTTLAARRQTLYLKRMRGAALSDRSILTGLLTPLVVLNLTQLAIILGVLAATGAPANPLLLITTIVLTEAMFTALALATAGLSSSPENAQYTTSPILLAATAAAIWVQASGSHTLIAVKRALPGGAQTELIMTAWNGGPLTAVPLLLLTSLAWTALGVLAARTFFRWEPRR